MKVLLDAVLNIDVGRDVLIKRLTGRRTCRNCQQMYNVYFSPPKKEGVCDECGGELSQRDDDKEETVRKRLDVYDAQTLPLINYYRERGKLKTVQGIGNIDEIFKKICDVLQLSKN